MYLDQIGLYFQITLVQLSAVTNMLKCLMVNIQLLKNTIGCVAELWCHLVLHHSHISYDTLHVYCTFCLVDEVFAR